MKSLLSIFFFIAYVAITWYSLILESSPVAPCEVDTPDCFSPLVKVGDTVFLELSIYHPRNESKVSKWHVVEDCSLNFTVPETGTLPKLLTGNGTSCAVDIPPSARFRSTSKRHVKPLRARFVFKDADGVDHATVPFELTRPKERRPGSFWGDSSSTKPARNLLDKNSEAVAGGKTSNENDKRTMWVPYLKYGRAAIRVRFVAEERGYRVLKRADGVRLEMWNASTYMPTFYVDEMSLQRSAALELAPAEDKKPPVQLHIKFSSVSPPVDTLIRQTASSLSSIEAFMPGDEVDEIRYFLQDERLYRFLITQVISIVHMWLDYLAFRDEISFYRGKKNFSGVSASTVITRFVCSFIILLYLLDGGGTSWVVLVSLISSCSVEAWKVWRLLRPSFSPRFPFVKILQHTTSKEEETMQYDRIATTNLAMFLYPLVVGWSLYALNHYEYRSWYSWLVSNLANAVYTFGFISLCPQLYVNYRLKSVAHLPWKVFMYKIFNTFVDDAFAWLIDMPMKHRLMTLRDDVVFLLFLVQVYMYRVDKSRTNEFGYAYDEEPEKGMEENEKEKKE